MNDFLFISKISLPMEVKLNFRYFISFHATVKANCKRSLLEEKKREIIRTSSHLRLHSVMSVAVLWRECLLPLKNRPQTVAFWEESTAANLTHESVWSWLFLALGLGLDNHMKTHSVGQLEIDIQEAETDSTTHLQRASSYMKCMSANQQHRKRGIHETEDYQTTPAVWLMLPFSYFASACRLVVWPPSGRCGTTNCSLEKMRHVWQAVCCLRFQQLTKCLDSLCRYKNKRPLNTAFTMPGCTKIVSRSWVHSKGPGWTGQKPSKNLCGLCRYQEWINLSNVSSLNLPNQSGECLHMLQWFGESN